MMLGMVGPFVIKTVTSGLERVGRTAGTVYAISTLGSVAGTLILGFYLLPILGTQTIIISLSLLMFVMALVLAVFERKRMGARRSLPFWGATTAMSAFILVSMVAQINGRAYHGYEVVFEVESPYGWVRDRKSTRLHS